MRWRTLLVVVLTACSSDPPRPVAPVKRTPTDKALRETSPVKCPSSIDVVDLMARHARAFGSRDAVAKSLPVTMLGEAEVEDKKGRAQLVVGPSGYRGTTALPGYFNAWGRDSVGLWGMRGSVGGV